MDYCSDVLLTPYGKHLALDISDEASIELTVAASLNDKDTSFVDGPI